MAVLDRFVRQKYTALRVFGRALITAERDGYFCGANGDDEARMMQSL
jgi:hypothetical protein